MDIRTTQQKLLLGVSPVIFLGVSPVIFRYLVIWVLEGATDGKVLLSVDGIEFGLKRGWLCQLYLC